MNRQRLVLVGLAAGLLSGLLGVGGGIVIVPGLVWAAGLDRHTATGTSLLAILPMSVVSTLTYALAPGGAFDPGASALLIAGSVAGAVLGSHINARLSERTLRLLLGVISGVFGLRLVLPFGFGAGTETLALDPGTVIVLIALGVLGGVLAGVLGTGGSAIAIALIVILLGTSQVLAQGIGLAAVIPTVIVAALAHRRLGHVSPPHGLVVGLTGALAAIPGAFLAFAIPSGALRAAFGVLLLVGSTRMLMAVRAPDRAHADG